MFGESVHWPQLFQDSHLSQDSHLIQPTVKTKTILRKNAFMLLEEKKHLIQWELLPYYDVTFLPAPSVVLCLGH